MEHNFPLDPKFGLQTIQVKDYLASLRELSNDKMAMRIILAPFGLPGDAAKFDLPIGLFCDYLVEEFGMDGKIDAFDAASIAWDLGLEAAGDFLDQGPHQIVNLRKAGF